MVIYDTDTGKKVLFILKKVGEGVFGQIYESLLDGYGKVAVKEIEFSEYNLNLLKDESKVSNLDLKYSILMKKIIVHPDMKHQLIRVGIDNKLIGTSTMYHLSGFLIIYDFIDSINLSQDIMLHFEYKLYYSNEVLLKYIGDLLYGLRELENNHIAHKDIKPGNIMLHRGGVKYIDFGFACKYSDCDPTATRKTPKYAAPEVWRQDYGDLSKIDLYAVGNTILKLLTSKTLIEILYPDKSMRIIVGKYFTKDHFNPAEVYKILSHTMTACPIYYLKLIPLIIHTCDFDKDRRYSISQAIDFFESNYILNNK